MELSEHIRQQVTGLQHIGIPTADFNHTVDFYHGLGFVTAYERTEPNRVAFLRLRNVLVETWFLPDAPKCPGAIDHIALDVQDVDSLFLRIRDAGYTLCHQEVQFLPFWEHGVRFFTIEGPNAEKIEFSEML